MQTSSVKEVSIRDMIMVLRSYLHNAFRRWPWLLLGAALGAAWMAWSASQENIVYEAKTTFVVNKSEGGGGGISTVLGQIGIGGGGGETNFYRVMNYATSRQLIYGLLLDSAHVDGQDDLLANHLIRAFKLGEKFELEEMYGLTHLSANTIEALPIRERSLLKMLYGFLVMDKSVPLRKSIDEVTDMLSFILQTPSEELTLVLTEGLYQALEETYTRERTGQSQLTVSKLEVKADSILKELTKTEYTLATFNDTRLSLANQRDQLRTVQLRRQIQILTVAYGEMIRNLETAKFGLSNQTPYFQQVEVPFRPLRKIYPNPPYAGALGLIYGAFAALLLVSMVHFYRQAMAESAAPSAADAP
jgi:hypothetical protein